MRLTRRGKVVATMVLMVAAFIIGLWWPYIWIRR